MNLRDKIKHANPENQKLVPVPEWDCNILIVGISALERTKWEESLVQGKGKKAKPKLDHARALLIVRAARDPETGDPLFQPDDHLWLSEKSSKPISRLYDVAAELAGITDDDIEELAEN